PTSTETSGLIPSSWFPRAGTSGIVPSSWLPLLVLGWSCGGPTSVGTCGLDPSSWFPRAGTSGLDSSSWLPCMGLSPADVPFASLRSAVGSAICVSPPDSFRSSWP
ncbi:unnamed protein product, partial [Laminaria digitata]